MKIFLYFIGKPKDPHANALAADFVDDDKTDQTVFPSAESRARLFMDRPLSPEAAAARARIWSRTKP